MLRGNRKNQVQKKKNCQKMIHRDDLSQHKKNQKLRGQKATVKINDEGLRPFRKIEYI